MSLELENTELPTEYRVDLNMPMDIERLRTEERRRALMGGGESLPGGVSLPVENIVERDPEWVPSESQSLGELPEELLNNQSPPEPTPAPAEEFYYNGKIYRKENSTSFDAADMTPEAKELFNNNTVSARAMLRRYQDTEMEADAKRLILGKMEIAAQLSLPVPGKGGIEEKAYLANMSVRMAEYFQENEPEYLEEQIARMEVLRNSGTVGYFTERMQNPDDAAMLRHDAVTLAKIEADYLGIFGGTAERIRYDLRAGIGNVAAFGIGMPEAAAKGISDFIGSKGVFGQWFERQSEGFRDARLNVEANMIGSEIDTGSPTLDYLRSGFFRNLPFMAATTALTGGVSTLVGGMANAVKLSSAAVGFGMGSETYNALRSDGVTPGVALAASAATSVASYFSTKFQLDNLTRYYRGMSPIGLFSAKTLGEVAGEAGQEAVENMSQTTAESLARLIGDSEYTSTKFWNDMKTGFLGSLNEGASAGITTAAMRVLGFPVAARNQMRAVAADRSDRKVAAAVSGTEIFKENPEALASQLDNMARHHGDGMRFSTVERLNQAGITREQAVAPVAEGGLGVSAEAYDEAAATEGIVAVGYGKAIVFGEKQAEAGNKAARGAFMANPEYMSVGDIAMQRADAQAVIVQAESYFQEEVVGDPPKTPLRLKIFKAGMRASGFNVNQAAALTAVFRAGAERNAELAGVTVEEWLEKKNVRLEFERTLLGTGNAAATRYVNLLRELDGDQTGQADGEAAAPAAPAEAAQAGTEGAVSEPLTQPISNPEENAAWVDEATANIVNSLGLKGEEFAPLTAEIRAAVERGINDPDVREMAGRLGIALPTTAGNYDDVSNKIGKFFDLTQNSPSDSFIEMVVEDKLSSREVERIREKSGRDLTGFSRTMDNYGIIHTLNNHGEGNENESGQIPVTREDFLLIPDVVGDPDNMQYRKRKGTADTITSEKEIGGVVYVVEEIRTQAKKLAFKTMYKKIEGDWQNQAPRKIPGKGSESPSINTIPGKDGDVNSGGSITETLYQSDSPPRNLGSITFAPDATVINLFKGANVSTVVHELNHLFLNDLIGLVKAGKGGEAAHRHFDALNAFADGNLLSEDREKRRDAYEKIARAWERYAMTAEAPASNLEEPFATIRKYMAAAYRNVKKSPLVEPSPEVRRVFDEMLATDRQIKDAAEIRETNADWTRVGDVSEDIRRRMAEINARRDDRARKRRDARQGAGRAMRNESSFDARRKAVREELLKEPAYRAIGLAREKGGILVEEAVAVAGQKAVDAIREKHGDNVFNGTGSGDFAHAGSVAASSGFDDAAAMLNAMLNAEPIDVRAEREARAGQDADDLAEDIAHGEEEETEGADDDTAEPGDMSAEEERTADEQDMLDEAGLAVENQYEGAREKSDSLREFRNDAAGIKRAAYASIGAMTMREAANITAFRSARNSARRRAFTAQGRGLKGKVAALKKQELFHFHQMQAAKGARRLRTTILDEYSSGGLRSTINALSPETKKLRDVIEKGYRGDKIRVAMNAAEHNAKIENEYARTLAEIALYAGFGKSRFIEELAGSRATEKTLVLPAESGELEGMVDGIADTIDPWLINKERPGNFNDFRDFTVEQLMEIDRVMRWLIDAGRGKLTYIKEKDAKNLEELTWKSIEPMMRRENRESDIDGNERTRTGSLRNRIGKFIIGLTLPENWFMAMDGNPTISGGAAGFNQRILFDSMRNANVSRGILYGDVMERMKPGFDTLVAIRKRMEKAFGGKHFDVEGLSLPEIMKRGRNISQWDADLLLSVALQMGNDANLRRLLSDEAFDERFGTEVTPEDGQDMSVPRYNFTNAQLDILAGLFTEAEWNAIQSLWDANDTLYGKADAVTFALTNRHVRKEQPTPLPVRRTADGKEILLRGGYFPLVNDPRLSDKAAQLREGQSIEEYVHSGAIGNVYGSTKQSVGAIKSRARDEKGVPMSTLPQILSTDILVQHVDSMTHYITHALPLRDIDRMTRSEEWRGVYIAKFGRERYDAIRKWIKNLAMPERGDASAGGKFMEHLRSLATVNALGLRWKTGIKQRLGAFNAAAYMGDAAGSYFDGWKFLTQGMHHMGIRGGLGFQNQAVLDANAKSEFMAARDGGFDREIRAMQSRVSPLSGEFAGRTLKEYQNMAFFWVQANDRAMAYSVWWGAYFQAKAGKAGFGTAAEEGETIDQTDARIEAEAVAFADRAAATQASSFAADLTENQRDRGFMRFMSMFMSGNVRQGSRLMQYIDAYQLGDKTKADVVMLAAKEFAFPALAWVFTAAAVKYAMYAALGFDDDDDGNLLAEAAWEVAGTAAAPFPLVRELPRVVQYGFMAGDVPAVKSAAQALNNLFGVPGRLAEARYMLAVGQTMRAAGYAVGIPVMNPLDDFIGFSVSEAVGLKNKK